MSGGDGVFTAGMQAVVELSAVVGAALNPHLKLLLTAVSASLYGCDFWMIICWLCV